MKFEILQRGTKNQRIKDFRIFEIQIQKKFKPELLAEQ